MKLKSRPTLREGKRYIVFNVITDGSFLYENLRNAIYDSVARWLGESEMGKADVHVIKNLWDGRARTGFIRCAPKYVDDVKTALALVHQIGESRVIIHTLRVSGTIKSAREKAGLSKRAGTAKRGERK
jgi:ribonuclease P/MRP protein subunit POP5